MKSSNLIAALFLIAIACAFATWGASSASAPRSPQLDALSYEKARAELDHARALMAIEEEDLIYKAKVGRVLFTAATLGGLLIAFGAVGAGLYSFASNLSLRSRVARGVGGTMIMPGRNGGLRVISPDRLPSGVTMIDGAHPGGLLGVLDRAWQGQRLVAEVSAPALADPEHQRQATARAQLVQALHASDGHATQARMAKVRTLAGDLIDQDQPRMPMVQIAQASAGIESHLERLLAEHAGE